MKTHSATAFLSQAIAIGYIDRLLQVMDRFTREHVDAEFCVQRAKHGASRQRLAALVTTSMRNAPLSAEQQISLDQLRLQTSVVAVTGQQVGLFGGPMYTIYKIRTAVEEARRITSTTGITTVPVFWLEDNDHDAAEAASSHLLNSYGAVVDVSIWAGLEERTSVSTRTFNELEIEHTMGNLNLLTGQYAELARQRSRSIYTVGASWTDAFLNILQTYLAAWGVLVVRGSDVIAAGLHAPILQHEIRSPGQLYQALKRGTDVLVARGFSAQATVSTNLFFGSDSDGRVKGPVDATLATEHPERFTPTVLTRPLIQDAILPSVVSILGAAEIAYHAQLREAYELCGIPMPFVVLRNGATLLDAKTEKMLSKDNRGIEWYRRNNNDLEGAIADELTVGVLPSKEAREDALEELLAPYRKAATIIDQTLVGNVGAQGASIRSTLEALEGKLRSAAKKTQGVAAERMRGIHAILFPNGTLQERNFPLLFWEARFGEDNLRIIVDKVAREPAGSHVEVGSSDLFS